MNAEGTSHKMVPCGNCKKEVEDAKLVLHEAYCYRNIIACKLCSEYYDKRDPESHLEIHTLVKCKFCSQDIEQRYFQNHQENTCENKPKFCRFCETHIIRDDFKDHVVSCSSRTKLCHKCGKHIILRDYDDHEAICILSRLQQTEENIKKQSTQPAHQLKDNFEDDYDYDYDYDPQEFDNLEPSEPSEKEEEEGDDDYKGGENKNNGKNQNKKRKKDDDFVVNDEEEEDEEEEDDEVESIDYDQFDKNNSRQESTKARETRNSNKSKQLPNQSQEAGQTKRVLLRKGREEEDYKQNRENIKQKQFNKIDRLIEQKSMKTRGNKKVIIESDLEDEHDYENELVDYEEEEQLQDQEGFLPQPPPQQEQIKKTKEVKRQDDEEFDGYEVVDDFEDDFVEELDDSDSDYNKKKAKNNKNKTNTRGGANKRGSQNQSNMTSSQSRSLRSRGQQGTKKSMKDQDEDSDFEVPSRSRRGDQVKRGVTGNSGYSGKNSNQNSNTSTRQQQKQQPQEQFLDDFETYDEEYLKALQQSMQDQFD